MKHFLIYILKRNVDNVMVKKTSSEWYFSDIDHDILYGEGWVEEVKKMIESHDMDEPNLVTPNLSTQSKTVEFWYSVPITYRKYNEMKSNSTTVNFNKNDHVEPFSKDESNSECIIL